MRAALALKALSLNDMRLVRRQALLAYMVVFPVLFALLARWGIPELAVWMEPWFDLEPYYPLVVSLGFVLTTPFYYGFVIGFLLLDERDDRTLTALRVTPLPMRLYLVYRVTGLMIMCLIGTWIAVPLSGLVDIPFRQLTEVALLASAEAAIVALFLASVAANKVEGFALVKALGILVIGPLLGYFMEPTWQWLVGVLPSFWPARAFWRACAGQPGYLSDLLIGWVMHLFLLWFFLRRFNRVVLR